MKIPKRLSSMFSSTTILMSQIVHFKKLDFNRFHHQIMVIFK